MSLQPATPEGRSAVLYGIGSPLVIELEESCARAGVRIAAGVRNVDGAVHTSAEVRVVERNALTRDDAAHEFLIGLFTPAFRLAARNEALGSGFTRGMTLIDPTAIVARNDVFGEGVYVNAGCVIGAAARLGSFVLVNRSASVGHHVVLDDFVSIGPGVVLGGGVRVGRGTMIGAGAIVLAEVQIGSNAVIGAGSVVRADVPSNAMAAGNPARIVKTGIAGYKERSV
jgi:sugar O-acyltransferase (sialic acid O-acetyltransferase NeuD family)